MLQDPDQDVRRMASWAVGKMAQNKLPGDYPLEPLQGLTKDPDPEVRENAAWAIGEMAGLHIGDASSIDFLNDLLQEDDPELKGMAAWSLGRMADKMYLGNRSSLALLKNLENDASVYVQKSAVFALERLAKLGLIP